MFGRNGRTTRAPPPPEPEPEPERRWNPLDIFNLGLNKADIAESVLLDKQCEVSAEREAADEKEPVADPEQAAILESCRMRTTRGMPFAP
jgi:hypothetical protein